MRDAVVFLIACIMFIGVLFSLYKVDVCSAEGSTFYVGSGQTYTSIQDAIDAAGENDTIYVYSGTYNENLVVDKTLTISGIGGGTKTIKGASSSLHTIQVSADYVNISGFTIENSLGATTTYSCIFLSSSNDCSITDNIIQKGDSGLYLVSSNDNTINGNTIKDNEKYGVILTNSDGNTVNGNSIQSNNNGVYLTTYSSSNIIYDNTISDNSYGVKTHISNSNTFYLNKFLENNVENAHDSNTNSWSYNSQGNYWSDYSDYDNNSDGIGDSPYIIPGGVNQDDYPLGYFLTFNPMAYIESISPNPADEGQSISFNGYGTPVGSIINWEWKANGDVISNSEDFSTSSLSAGTYTISFRVQATDETWSDYAQSSLTINAETVPQNQRPFAFIQTVSPTTTTYGEQIYFYGHGTDTDGMIVEYYWSSSHDGKIAGTQSFYKSDLSVGSHTIYFKVKDNHGDWSEYSTASVTVNPDTSVPNTDPVADAGGPYSSVANTSITFDGSNSYDPDEDDSISTYSWSLGDGTTGTGVTVEHYYTSAGNYTVVLTVTDTHGSQSTNTITVSIADENNGDNGGNGGNNGNDEKFVIPGFEMIIFFFALVFIVLFKNVKKN